MSNLEKYNAIEKIIGSFTLFAVWNKDTKCWFRSSGRDRPYYDALPSGVFITECDAIMAAKNINYAIIDISIKDKIPEDLLRLQELGACRGMMISKIRQLINVFVFQNGKLQDELKRKY